MTFFWVVLKDDIFMKSPAKIWSFLNIYKDDLSVLEKDGIFCVEIVKDDLFLKMSKNIIFPYAFEILYFFLPKNTIFFCMKKL